MGKRIVQECFSNVWFIVFSLVSIFFLVAGFLVPPMGVIDASVLTAVGELFAFATLGTVIRVIDKAAQVKLEHKDTKITVENPSTEQEKEVGD